MRKLVVLLAIAALVSGAAAVLAGCGPPAATDQPIAAPAETTPPLLKPTAVARGDHIATPQAHRRRFHSLGKRLCVNTGSRVVYRRRA